MKKILVTVLAMALLCIMAVGGTLSYFTDTDADVNVMTVGKVEIVQHEKDRNGEKFKNDKFYPYTGAYGEDGYPVVESVEGFDYKMLSTANNAVDKIVTVENTGSEDAYIRTLFAFEMTKTEGKNEEGNKTVSWENPVGTSVCYILNKPEFAVDEKGKYTLHGVFSADETIKIFFDSNGVACEEAEAASGYIVGVYTYTEKLSAPEGESESISAPSLLQIYLDKKVQSDFADWVGGSYDILVLSQAVQAQGFEEQGAEYALTAAFGEITAANAADWFSSVTSETETETP